MIAARIELGQLEVDPAEVCRLMGVNPSKGPSPAVKRLIEQAYAQGPKLLRPAATRVWLTASYSGSLLELEIGATLDTGRPLRGWSRLEKVAICLCTLGSPLEGQVTRLLHAGGIALPAALDAFGSAAMVAVTHRLQEILASEAGATGMRLGPQGEAGTGRWDLRQQTVLHRLADGDSIDVGISEQSILIPRKSICLVVPAGRSLKPVPWRSQCGGCTLVDCAYRAGPSRKDSAPRGSFCGRTGSAPLAFDHSPCPDEQVARGRESFSPFTLFAPRKRSYGR